MTKKATLLLVDDDPQVLNALERLIGELSLPLVVTCTTETCHAVEQLSSNTYDLLLTDQRMPKMSGIALIEHARSIQSDIHCILMSGYSDFDMIVSAITAGQISGFIMKPWKITDVESALLKVLQAKHD